MNAPPIDEIPQPFLALWKHAEQLMKPGPAQQRGSLYLLPASLRSIATSVEQSAQFDEFIRALFPDLTSKKWRISEELRRSGFYHSLRSGSEPDAAWRALAFRLRTHTTENRTLALLDGCWFPLDHLEIAGVAVHRLSPEALRELGPGEDVAGVFFPTETLDSGWFSQVWFLSKARPRETKPGSIRVRLGYDLLHEFWETMLGLALYKTDHFSVPIVLESDARWRLERVRWAEPMSQIVEDNDGETIEVPRTDYDVDKSELARFTAFLAFYNAAIETAQECQPFRLAARRFLRANDIAGPYAFSADDHEDALLQYTFALEALLAAGEREAIGDKLATRAAWLVGTTDQVRSDTYRAVKKLYSDRSSIVHGANREGKKRSSRLLDEVRDLSRRVLLALLALRQTTASDNECFDILKAAAFDTSCQSAIMRATESVWPIIDAGIPYPGPSWGPTYERFPFVEQGR